MQLTNSIIFFLAAAAVASTTVANVGKRSSGTAHVYIGRSQGAATQLGSGFIYGFPDNGTDAEDLIPDSLVSDMGFRYGRAGGAQTTSAGWAYGGYDEYIGRFQSSLSNYRSVRKYSGEFFLLPHDMWGAQGGATTDTPFPGDNGNWTEMELFLNQLISDMEANDMLDGVIIDLWNEPDLDGFWAKSWAQYLEYITRATIIFRAALPYNSISGPSAANAPFITSDKWITWAQSVVANDVVPDIYSWHQIGSWQREPDTTIPDFNTIQSEYGLPWRPIAITEYAWPSEQNPANDVFYLAQLERHDLMGLRANWGGGGNLHDYLASLLGKNGDTYFPNGEWQLYSYYENMVGDRVVTAASADYLFDVFAVQGDIIRILAGTRSSTNSYDIIISGLDTLGLGVSGSLGVRMLQFDFPGADVEVDGSTDLGITIYSYNESSFTITVTPATNSTAYAFEFGF